MGPQHVYGTLADAVVLVHLLWIVFLFTGGIWGRKYLPVRLFHIFGLALAFAVQVFDWYCPLTYLEVFLRQKAANNPHAVYTGSFITHYAEKLIYINLPRGLIVFATILLCGFNAFLYLGRRKKRPRTS
ncbi:MAG: DUF2784 domain-containing protein [Nitrospiraceae bacterium]|nr:DUF2784 domain-containing protein [Nitrospiraceae bacterium]MDA8089689.1 DUF2784 domain-containing protein [Nitrospiraceae bacterium]